MIYYALLSTHKNRLKNMLLVVSPAKKLDFESPLATEKFSQPSLLEQSQLLMDDCASITGISRTLTFLWDKNFIMKPDRSFVGGFFTRFVDLREPASTTP